MADFKVTAKTLSENASNLTTAAQAIESLVKALNEAKDTALGAWTGDAATKFAGQYEELSKSLSNVVSDAKRYGTNLEAIAKQYDDAEKGQITTIQGLETNVFDA